MRYLLLIALTTLAFGCRKPKTDNFMFDCVVFDQKINAPVAGANITMQVQRASGGFNPNWEVVGTAVSDANGNFYIEVEKEVFYAYRLEISHEQHFYVEFEISPDDVPVSSAYEATYNMEPRSWVAVHLQNDNISQTVTVGVDGNSSDCTECCDGSNTIIQGWPVDSTLICQVYGAETISVTGNYADINGGVHAIAETGTSIPFDTTTFLISY